MWHSLAVPALSLLLSLQADPELEARCRDGSIGACVGLASKLAATSPERATRLYDDACRAGHLDACLQACLGGASGACGRLDYSPATARELRRIHRLTALRPRLQAIHEAEDPVLLGAVAWALDDERSWRAAVARLAALSLPEAEAGLREDFDAGLAARSDDPLVRALEGAPEALALPLALRHPLSGVRRAAVRRVSDPRWLLWIAYRESHEGTLRVALERLGDPDALERFATASGRLRPRLGIAGLRAAVDLIEDPDRLLRIAREPTAPQEARAAAVAGLRDQAVLRALAWGEGPSEVQIAATNGLVGKIDLGVLALAHPVPVVRQRAVWRLGAGARPDPALLARIARTDADRRVRSAAVAALSDSQLLLELVADAPDLDARVAAVGRLADEAALRRIALDHPDAAVRGAAVGHLGVPETLAAVAREDADPEVRLSAVRRLAFGGFAPEAETDAILRELLRSSSHPEVRLAAARGLRDRAELRRLEREETDPKVRAAAANRLRMLSERERGESGGQLLLSGQYGSEGFTAGVGVIVGSVERADSHTVPVPDTLRGVLVEAEVGARSFKASVGVGGAAAWLPVLSTGTAVKLSYLNRRGGGPAGSDSNDLGLELDIWMLAKLTLGVFKSLESDGGYRLSWGIGFGI